MTDPAAYDRSPERIQYLFSWAKLEHLESMVEQGIKGHFLKSWNTDKPSILDEVELRVLAVFRINFVAYAFRRENLPKIYGVLDLLEARIADPGYQVRKSPTLQATVKALSGGGRRAVVKKKATSVITVGSAKFHTYLDGMRFTLKTVGSSDFFYVVYEGSNLFVFQNREEEDILQDLGRIVLKKDTKAPRSVVLKKVLIRIDKIMAGFEAYNAGMAREVAKFNALPLKTQKKQQAARPVPIATPVLNSIAAFKAMYTALPGLSYSHGYRVACGSLTKVLEQDSVDDELFAEAWEIYSVKHIMRM